MAKRLATNYVHAHLRLTETSFNELCSQMNESAYEMNVMVYENGNQEIVLVDKSAGAQHEVVLPVEKQQHEYVILAVSIRLTSFALSEIIRRAILEHHGDATVQRIYEGSTFVYEYRDGTVIRITERLADQQERLVFENKQKPIKLQQLFKKQHVERQIKHVRDEIDGLLDERIVAEKHQQYAIDEELRHQSKKLFMLEP